MSITDRAFGANSEKLLVDSNVARPIKFTALGARKHLLRAGLLTSCVLASVAAVQFTDLSATRTIDPDLTMLLRGMAVIKAAAVFFALAVLWWRFAFLISPTFAAGYTTSAAVASGATVLIWNSTHLGFAAFCFHSALFAFVILGLRDDRRPRLLKSGHQQSAAQHRKRD